MISIAIDGPGGAGKSTIAKALSKKLNYIYVDTGALYRAIGLYIYRLGINTKDAEAVSSKLKEINLELKHIDGEQKVFLNGEDVSTEIRLPEMSMAASNISAIPKVREFLLNLQRDIAVHNNIIMDGRDIGTVILPNAQVKIYLTASPERRAQRRYKELIEKGMEVTFEKVLSDIIERDRNDMNREVAPLKMADDAVLVDSDNMNAAEVMERIIEIMQERL